MKNIKNVVIELAIAHTLMRNENGGIRLSQRTDPLNDKQLISYYTDQIKKSLNDAGTKVAKFKAIAPEYTSGICRDLLHEKYLFNWSEIPGNDTGKFIDFLKQNYNVDWIKPDEIRKINGDERIEAVSSSNSLSMSFNNEKTQIDLVIDNIDQDDKFVVKNENGEVKVYKDRLDFVEGSKILAEKLHTLIEKDRRPKQCDLVICIFRDGDNIDKSAYLALLDIELSKGLTRKVERDSNGLEYITYDLDKESLPNITEKLQKCAFIQQLDPRLDYDMLVLDKNVEDISQFFFEGFLGAESAYDNATLTKKLIKGLKIACNEVLPTLEPDQAKYLGQTIETAIQHENFNKDVFVTQLSIPKEAKDRVEQVLSKNLPNMEIEIDKKATKPYVTKATYIGDGGLKISIDRDKKEKFIKVKYPDDKDSYHRIEIKTKKWKEEL